MRYKWFSLLIICSLFLTGCQSVKDFFKPGDKAQESGSELEQATSVDDILDMLPDAQNVAERLKILQEAYTVLAEEDADQSAFIIQSLNTELSELHISVTPDYQQCELGDSFNILVAVKSDSGLPVGAVPLEVRLEDGSLFDSLETGPDGVFFGEFRCGTASGTGEKEYSFRLALDEIISVVGKED